MVLKVELEHAGLVIRYDDGVCTRAFHDLIRNLNEIVSTPMPKILNLIIDGGRGLLHLNRLLFYYFAQLLLRPLQTQMRRISLLNLLDTIV